MYVSVFCTCLWYCSNWCTVSRPAIRRVAALYISLRWIFTPGTYCCSILSTYFEGHDNSRSVRRSFSHVFHIRQPWHCLSPCRYPLSHKYNSNEFVFLVHSIKSSSPWSWSWCWSAPVSSTPFYIGWSNCFFWGVPRDLAWKTWQHSPYNRLRIQQVKG